MPLSKGISDFIASHLTLFYYLLIVHSFTIDFYLLWSWKWEKFSSRLRLALAVIGINNNFYREFCWLEWSNTKLVFLTNFRRMVKFSDFELVCDLFLLELYGHRDQMFMVFQKIIIIFPFTALSCISHYNDLISI